MLTRRQFLLRAARAGTAAVAASALASCAAAGRRPFRPPTSSAAQATLPPPAGPASAAAPAPDPWEPPPVLARRADYPIAREARLAGTDAWFAGAYGDAAAQGYLSRASVGPGEGVTLQIASGAPSVDVDWYRLGWYGGTGGRLVRHDSGIRPGPLLRPAPDPATGLVEAGWGPSLELQPGPDWTSGMYVAVLRAQQGDAGYVPFVVRPRAATAPSGAADQAQAASPAEGPAPADAPAPVLFVHAATTWQAYNGWGGKSLYNYNSSGITMPVGTTRAVTVSFDRPYLLQQGAGLLFFWELQFVRWQERHRRDVEYIADVDLVLHPELLTGRRMLVFAGHHEYWSRGMREAVEAAIAGGTSVLFLSANEMYQQVRFEDSNLGTTRRVTCYKSAAADPLASSDPRLVSVPWRAAPLREPEATVVGQMYAHVVETPADWRVERADHWLYQGTGLHDGDRLTNLVGQEYDTFFPQYAPPGTVLLARSPVQPNCVDPTTPALHTATMYRAPSGATVFAAGTYQWSWAMDAFGERSYAGVRTPLDRRVSIMAANLFNRLGDGVT